VKGFGVSLLSVKSPKDMLSPQIYKQFPNWCASILTKMFLWVIKADVSLYGGNGILSRITQDNKEDPGSSCPREV
jgi:hypothetical protein